jgi:hypothetical protein
MVFSNNQKTESGITGTGESHPPKKQITIIIDNHNMLLYSAKKNNANVMAEYSTLKPATSSASASGKSKGARFVSANNEMKNTIQTGRRGKKNQVPIFCCCTISIKLKEFAQIEIGNSSNPIETSYEISCAAERNDPKNAYFELLDQPAPITPYTPIDDIA